VTFSFAKFSNSANDGKMKTERPASFRSLKWISLLALSALGAGEIPVPEGVFSGRFKVICEVGPEGCPCRETPSLDAPIREKFRHLTPVISTSREIPAGAWTQVDGKAQGKSCWYPSSDLRPIYWENLLCPSPGFESAIPFEKMENLLSQGSIEGERRELGVLFPTMYNIADESFFEGERQERLVEAHTGKTLAWVSRSYRSELDIQGTGRLKDGRILNVAERVQGVWNYRVLPAGEFGHGILNHRIHPLRSVAVDFTYLCQLAGLEFCDFPAPAVRARLVGSVLYFPRLDGVKLATGQTHDGLMCAQDIGGAIGKDRVDLFVGPMGAGNPYLPECRQRNAFLDAGISSLTPSDWPSVVRDGVDSQGRPTFRRKDPLEYRTASPEKGLQFFLVAGAKCRP
jgi:hypothetical protein